MTWKRIQVLVSALLTNNMVLTDNESEKLVLLEYALQEVANKAVTLRLLTTNVDDRITKHTSDDGVFMRTPALPVNDEEVIDIDEALCFAVARYMASFVTEDINMIGIHERKAVDIINQYNTTVESYKEGVSGYDDRQSTVFAEY